MTRSCVGPLRSLEDRPLMSVHGGDAVLRRTHQQHRNLHRPGGLYRTGPGVRGAQRGHRADARVHGRGQHGGTTAHGVAADSARGRIDRQAVPVVGRSSHGHRIERSDEIGAERLMAGQQPGPERGATTVMPHDARCSSVDPYGSMGER